MIDLINGKIIEPEICSDSELNEEEMPPSTKINAGQLLYRGNVHQYDNYGQIKYFASDIYLARYFAMVEHEGYLHHYKTNKEISLKYNDLEPDYAINYLKQKKEGGLCSWVVINGSKKLHEQFILNLQDLDYLGYVIIRADVTYDSWIELNKLTKLLLYHEICALVNNIKINGIRDKISDINIKSYDKNLWTNILLDPSIRWKDQPALH